MGGNVPGRNDKQIRHDRMPLGDKNVFCKGAQCAERNSNPDLWPSHTVCSSKRREQNLIIAAKPSG